MNTFRFKRWHKIAFGLILVLVAGGILAALYLYNMQGKDLQKVKPDFILSASELQGAFEADEAAASSNYINKIIEVSGEIESVKEGENQTFVVTLKTENPVSAVSCTFHTASGKPEFKEGDYISLRGQCSGFLMDVIMNNCTVVNKRD